VVTKEFVVEEVGGSPFFLLVWTLDGRLVGSLIRDVQVYSTNLGTLDKTSKRAVRSRLAARKLSQVNGGA